MLKINSNKFNFNFFLSSRKAVPNLETGAIENGGATKINNKTYSNIKGSDLILLNNIQNTLAICIPSTIDVNTQCDNSKYINYSIDYIQSLYNNSSILYEATQGSWYSEDLQKVVYDDITIVSVTLEQIAEKDIQNFVTLAKYIKHEMSQEGVSITINDSLAII